jgi:hypothetical protein
MLKRHKILVVNVLRKKIDDGVCHSGNLIEPAIRHGEQCEIGCPESVNVLLENRFRTSELTSNVPFAVRSTFRNDWMGT